ncbi:hypothetical protein ABTL59_19565, partial [Acinetobacter baumannii]
SADPSSKPRNAYNSRPPYRDIDREKKTDPPIPAEPVGCHGAGLLRRTGAKRGVGAQARSARVCHQKLQDRGRRGAAGSARRLWHLR